MYKNIIGQRFGKLIVVSYIGTNDNRQSIWLCRCDCGNEKEILRNSLTSGRTLSCGCYHKAKAHGLLTTHGKCSEKIYKTWITMKRRCFEPNFASYKNYGARVIEVCAEWLDFETFYKWSYENNYIEGLSIERKDNNKGYEPSNCEWITLEAQHKNRRNNHYITIGAETKTLTEWSKISGLSREGIRKRELRGIIGKDLIKKV